MSAATAQSDLKIVETASDKSSTESGTATPKSESTEVTTPEEVDPRLKDATVGSITDIKSLYQGPEDSQGRAQWLDKYPDDVEEAAETEETAKYALIARKTKCYNGRRKFDIDSIVVQSPALKEVLGRVFKGYPGITCSLDRLEFNDPFEPFVHRWLDFIKARDEEKDEVTRGHLDLLHGLLKEELKDTIKALEDYVVHGVITFKHLWAIFQPGATLYSQQSGSPRAYTFRYGNYETTQCGKAFSVGVESVSWNGTTFGRGTEYINIFSFMGTRPIKDLNICPLVFHPEQETIRKLLIARGEKFEELAGYHYKSYNGVALSWNAQGSLVPLTVTGRVIIDTDSFDRFNTGRTEGLDPLENKDFRFEEVQNGEPSSKALNIRLTPRAHLICKATVKGYSLKLKKWLYFFIDLIGEIVWNDNAFSTLVLPSDTKDLIMSFVESQVENKNKFDDVIEGKGKGIIMLLSGPPGVGKTLTAESVAEAMHIPLYMMSAGDLGTSPTQVERALQGILEMVAKWNAILLLDECDVFLEARTTHDLERNQLVSIFLRMLEYYEGILFLTTNRVSDMDAAFQSRIHVSMAYPDLTQESRKQIWANFLNNNSQKNVLTDEDLSQLAQRKLNGRQIKNVIKTAFLLALRKKQPLTREAIETVLAIEGRRPDM
ncbi:ATPase [Xylogone sp. PMI_703]|nr:ATPase [Xylogone sp. PMI_703]